MLDAPNLLTMDMGGTSTDISIIRDGAGTFSQHGKVGDFPIIMPVMAIEAIGAGGGSIAWMDGPILKVGPHSAGARPGPACYNLGGVRPTVSDAYLLCGLLSEATPLAGGIRLRRDRAEKAMQPIADALGCDVVKAAENCITVATSNMLAKTLPFIARIGSSPSELTLMIFGGAGAIHGPMLSAETGIGKIIVPKFSSVFCAFGGLVTDLLYDAISPARGKPLTPENLTAAYDGIKVEAAEWLRKQAPDLVPSFEYTANLRYAGQSFDVPTVLDAAIVENGDMEAVAERFHVEHERLYMHAHKGRDINAISYQLRVRGKLPAPGKDVAISSRRLQPESSPGRLFLNNAWHDVRRYRQETLPRDWTTEGPAIVEQVTATTVVPPGFSVRMSSFGDLIMERMK
jgi:N-methylhydantoinase A